MESNKNIQKYAAIAGIFVCAFFPFLIFSESLFIDLCTQICNFGIFWNPIFWGILFPLFIVFLFWNTAKKISPSLNELTYFTACSRFSFRIISRIIISLLAIYIIGLFTNGISVILRSQIPYVILFSMLMILFLSFVLIILTFISSLIIVKASKTPKI
ncbi:hypothetical protein [Flavobacterium foetidum]|uniref:hypothetical protein n=1 Tax=Flavobacterium foetidum TaxID=2026681 RepID=UPI0010752358|nr:hypothetical protein [Flavobacterium foetidum]KAF2511865.1 hypothetical protein E0W73_16180 [Flavobacterium foetidum]